MKDHGDVTLETNGEYWRAAWWDNGRRIRRGLGHKSKVSERAAKRMCRDIAIANASSPDTRHMGKTPTIASWLDQFLELRRDEVSPGRWTADRHALDWLRRFAGDKRMGKFTAADADDAPKFRLFGFRIAQSSWADHR